MNHPQQPIRERRPANPQSSKSFSRFEPSHANPLSRQRASTLQAGTASEARSPQKLAFDGVRDGRDLHQDDIFEKKGLEDDSERAQVIETASNKMSESIQEGFDDLPIELVSLTDR